MHDFVQAFITGIAMLGGLDPEIVGIVALSLRVSLSASLIAMVIGAPLAGALAISGFRGQQVVIVIVNALLVLPTVVVGLAVYPLLTRSGPVGLAGLLFTPTAMVAAQTSSPPDRDCPGAPRPRYAVVGLWRPAADRWRMFL